MKFLLMIMFSIAITATLNAQTTNAQTTGGTKQTGQKRTQVNRQEKARQQRGTGQYYGSKDTTPGSPMGTGGAGGDMSGSPAASAIETDDQTSKAQVNKDSSDMDQNTANTTDTTVKKSTIKKTRSVRSKSRPH